MDLNKKLRQIHYKEITNGQFILMANEKSPSPFFGWFFFILGIVRLILGDFIFSIIPIIGGIIWISHSNSFKTKINKLKRKYYQIHVTPEGLIFKKEKGELLKEFDKDELSDLIIEDSKDPTLNYLVLKVKDKENKEIELVKTLNSEQNKSILNDVANLILEKWNAAS